MTVFDAEIDSLSGGPARLDQYRGNALLVVNVASQCGLTPQYATLQSLAERYADRGLVVLGVPCNQFGGQEPGTADEIRTFCETTYAVTFPMTQKVEVNGEHRHPLYAGLVDTADADGHTGDVRWNFEKFLVAPDGSVAGRFHPRITAEDPVLVGAVEKLLPR